MNTQIHTDLETDFVGIAPVTPTMLRRADATALEARLKRGLLGDSDVCVV